MKYTLRKGIVLHGIFRQCSCTAGDLEYRIPTDTGGRETTARRHTKTTPLVTILQVRTPAAEPLSLLPHQPAVIRSVRVTLEEEGKQL